ncbi:uncharacterized protein C8A04DRAFT_24546 [Dichotomopilus funicola]|uniref:Uncharacterized protein n=1 Tax=Dichotomopilus funicola TaxID=1934379 RepID=A0AAN6V9H1_9PEZI|nr:hypothetical protein C8A04DRAFT_24546 [Dichotomopilus funicola]
MFRRQQHPVFSNARHRPSGRTFNGSAAVHLPPAPHTYTVTELNFLDEASHQHVTQQHLFYALEHVVEVLQHHGITYGVMGGMSLVLLGNEHRITRDVDIGVDVGVPDMLNAFSRDHRVYRPSPTAATTSHVARIFVLVGGTHREPVRRLPVEVDLIRPGHPSMPRSLEAETEVITGRTALGPRRWNTLSLRYLFLSKLRVFHCLERDQDFRDLVWLCYRFPDDIGGFSPQLDENLRRTFFEAYKRTRPPKQKLGFIYGRVRDLGGGL